MTDTIDIAEHAPPQDILAESITLGAMMLSPSVADAITEIVNASDFYRPVHAAIFEAIQRLAARGEPFDGAVVAGELAKTGEISRVGGVPYLHTLIEAVPVAANGPHYAHQVADAATRRRVGEAGVKAQMLARSGAEVAEVRELAQQAMYEATTDVRDRAIITSVGDLIGPAIERMESMARGDMPPGISTGFADLDRLLGGGFRPGQLIIPAGRTSMGKSVITQNWLWHAAKTTMRPVVLFSVEMSRDEMMARLIAEVASVSLSRITEGGIDDGDRRRIAAAEQKILAVPMFIVDTVRTIPGIRAYLRRFRARMDDLAMFGVDYLQELTPVFAGRRLDRHLEVGEFARDLKQMAQDQQATCIAPCQLNRGPENRPGKVPGLADLRESGNLEQTADVAVLLHRPSYYDKASPRAGEADFIVAKNRNGPTDTITVTEQLHLSRFRDMVTLGEPEPRGWE
jgi:replicative DNA helicase